MQQPSMVMTVCWNCKIRGRFEFIRELKRSWVFKCKACFKNNVVDK